MSNPIIPGQNGSYQVFPFFSGTDAGAANAVYLLPPAFTYAQPVSLTVPLLYNGSSAGPLPAGYQNADFAIAFAPLQPGPLTSGNVGVNITLKSNNMWMAAATPRAGLMGNFVDFLQQIETQFEAVGLIIPGGTLRIRQQIADAIPAPPLETLFYRYSLSPGFAAGTVPYVDIRPGMQLRVETQSSQFLTPSSPLNGYVSSGRFPFLINSVPGPNGTRLVSFDPFLGTIKAPTVSGGATSPVVAGGLIDLEPASGARTYWRLFYPPSVSSPAKSGDLNINDNVTLVGASTLAQLNAATTAYPNMVTAGASPNVYVLFLGRALAVPEIPIWITTGGGLTTYQYVPLGTTIANIVERFSIVPLSVQSKGLVSVTRTTTATSAGTSPIQIFTLDQQVALLPAVFDVPLIAGDNVTLKTS
jgi:hypothetical protein